VWPNEGIPDLLHAEQAIRRLLGISKPPNKKSSRYVDDGDRE
jgi:hypothetical protein